MFYILSFLWFIRTTKAILFWLYLWQLKEYRLGRLLDHFRTEKGEKSIFNYLLLIKLFLVLGLFFWLQIFLPVLTLLYFFEVLVFLKQYFQKTFKKPVFTKKILFLLGWSLLLIFLILAGNWQKSVLSFTIFLLICDILAPTLFSGIVLIFQPFSILAKKQIIKKATEKRAKFKDLIVIGITGSYGKTSTKEFLSAILEEKFKVLKTPDHQNTDPAIAKLILDKLGFEHQIFIVEMAAYGVGEIKSPCEIVKPKIGILTGINEQHLSLFGSQENIVKTKYELIESLPEDGAAFFNAKNKYCLELYQKPAKIKKTLYGKEAKFLGEENILGAIAVAKELGMAEEEITQACQKIKNKFPGIKIKKGRGDLTIIDATYSANPDGVIAHLDYLKTFKGKKVIIMPCLIELSSASKEIHKRIGEKIGEICDLAIITTKERFEEMRQGAINNGMGKENILFLENPREIFEKIRTFFQKDLDSSFDSELKTFCQEGDVILLESKVPNQLINLLVY